MKKIYKIIIPILLILSIIFTLSACGEKEPEVETDNNGGMIFGEITDVENGEDTPKDTDGTESKPINIHTIKLQENEGVTSDGVVFDKTLTLNQHTFTLPCDLETFLTETKSVIKNESVLSNISATNDVTAECEITHNTDVIKYTIVVGQNKEGINIVKALTIKSDNRVYDDDFKGTPNLIKCGFEFFECDMDNNEFSSGIKTKYVEKAVHTTNEDGTKTYTLTLENAKGDYWAITMIATTYTADADYYFFDEVLVTTIKK